MHLVRYQLAVSLDGFIAPKDGSADWLEPYGKAAWNFLGPWMKNIGGIIVGRAMYDQSAGTGGWNWGKTPSQVMTSRPLPAKHAKMIEASDDPAAGLARLRTRMPEGDIWLFGGGITASGFFRAGLIDLLELAVVPVVLGEGKPLFPGVSGPTTFEYQGSQPIGDGAVVNTYKKIDAPARPASRPNGRRTKSR